MASFPKLKARSLPREMLDPEMDAARQLAPEDLPRLTLIRLLRDYDRRLVQLQDKVAFEREHNLVDYSKLPKR